MRVPLMIRIGGLVLATTGFYTYVGQMVPQKEVQPPQETKLGGNMTTADMVKVGREIMEGKGICLTCHTIGKTGALRFPDLAGIGAQAQDPRAGPERCRLPRPVDVRAHGLCRAGIPSGDASVNQPPIGLTDQEILSVIAALQALGGTPTVTLQTTHTLLQGRGRTGRTAESPGS